MCFFVGLKATMAVRAFIFKGGLLAAVCYKGFGADYDYDYQRYITYQLEHLDSS